MKFYPILFALPLLVGGNLPAFADELPQSSAQIAQASSLPASIHEKIKKAGLSTNDVSIWVKPMSGTPTVSHLADIPRTPASTQKLITTAIALEVLGADYRWQTRLYTDGVMRGDTLYGNLIIKGVGDPSLTHERLSAMFGELVGQGVRHIRGDIIVDNSAFVNVARDVNAFDGQGLRAYNAQPNAFLINFGTLEIKMTPSGTWATDVSGQVFTPTDSKVAVQVLPPLADFQTAKTIEGITNSCTTKPKFALSSDTLAIEGQVGIGCGEVSEWITFANADEFIRKSIKGAWHLVDKDFAGEVKVGMGGNYGIRPILSFSSTPLREQIYQINQYSNNVMTEQVALSLPLILGQETSDYTKSFAFMSAWWAKHLTTPAPLMSRASGLCRDCAVSVQALGELLEFAHRQPSFEVFKASLPIVGQTGTMKDFARRHPNSPAIGRAFIKTGRLSNVASIAGFVQGQSGQLYAVVAIINADNAGGNSLAHAVLDEVIEWTAGQP